MVSVRLSVASPALYDIVPVWLSSYAVPLRVKVVELVYLPLNWKSGLAATARYFPTMGDIVGDAPGIGDLTATLALAEALAACLPDAAAEGLEPVSALRLTAGRSTLQCMPAAL